jgi:hypothetical protein
MEHETKTTITTAKPLVCNVIMNPVTGALYMTCTPDPRWLATIFSCNLELKVKSLLPEQVKVTPIRYKKDRNPVNPDALKKCIAGAHNTLEVQANLLHNLFYSPLSPFRITLIKYNTEFKEVYHQLRICLDELIFIAEISGPAALGQTPLKQVSVRRKAVILTEKLLSAIIQARSALAVWLDDILKKPHYDMRTAVLQTLKSCQEVTTSVSECGAFINLESIRKYIPNASYALVNAIRVCSEGFVVTRKPIPPPAPASVRRREIMESYCHQKSLNPGTSTLL